MPISDHGPDHPGHRPGPVPAAEVGPGHHQEGVGQEQVERRGGHARVDVLKVQPANQEQTEHDGQVTAQSQTTLHPERNRRFISRRLILDHLGDRLAEPDVQRRGSLGDRGRNRLTHRDGNQTDKKSAGQPGQPGEVQVRTECWPAYQHQVEQAAEEEIAEGHQQPEKGPAVLGGAVESARPV